MPLIETDRLILRPVAPEDAPRFAALCNDETLARNVARVPHPYTAEDAARFVNHAVSALAAGEEWIFAVCRDDAVIACAGVMPFETGEGEIGYWVGAEARGQGVATEAGAAVMQYAFETLDTPRLTAGHFIDNPASARVLDKLGFRPTGETVQLFSLGRGEEVETVRLALRREAFSPPTRARIRDAR